MFALTILLADVTHSNESLPIFDTNDNTEAVYTTEQVKETAMANTLEVVEDVVQLACGYTTDVLTSKKEMKQLCEEMCMVYSCCFINGDDDNVSACQDPVTTTFCPSYKACRALY